MIIKVNLLKKSIRNLSLGEHTQESETKNWINGVLLRKLSGKIYILERYVYTHGNVNQENVFLVDVQAFNKMNFAMVVSMILNVELV